MKLRAFYEAIFPRIIRILQIQMPVRTFYLYNLFKFFTYFYMKVLGVRC
ncbi:Uncharacterized protein dnm_015070 [Desulfonema magnum]|uniref:Uncharacterized protein n=1 Tax=Desulfonema magnum TaxID=45655 RepID=A0A975GL59_9BACT|nr:Uncharacterized protein dnm_015070 [Desulfonema magnum]